MEPKTKFRGLTSEAAIGRLAALAQPTRLAAFRLLVRAGHDGLPAGEIADQLSIPANTASAHLAVLWQADLVHSRRQGRSIIYTAAFEAMAELMVFLTADCCQGNPDVCAPLAEGLSRVRC